MRAARTWAPVALALAAAITGYALTGRPALPSSPHRAVEADPLARPAIEAARQRLLSNTGDIGGWLLLADALARSGRTGQSVDAMQTAIKAYPRSPDLWVGLGNALVLHGGGEISPAARLAFGRANALDPAHPGPRYFLGLAWLQAGKPREARSVWEDLRRDSPADAPWLVDLDRKIRATRLMESMGVGTQPR